MVRSTTGVIAVSDCVWDGARGHGTSVFFRDPAGSLLEIISYE
jgi:catechol 2,3-dioxygenase-like lactoylglutathione lyase family enzyme